MTTPSEFRLVAYLIPTSSWGFQDNELDRPIIARKDQSGDPRYGLVIKRVGPPRGNPSGRMVYPTTSDVYFPDGETIDSWRELQSSINHAMGKDVLHREDFTHTFEL